MQNKIDKLLEAFENTTPPTLEETRNKIIKLFLKEYEKGKPKRRSWGSYDTDTVRIQVEAENRTLSAVDEVIYKMLKTK